MSRGWTCCDHRADIDAAEKHVIEVALAHGVQPRCEIYTLEQMQKYQEMGVRHFCIGDEFDILKDYWGNVGGAAKKAAAAL